VDRNLDRREAYVRHILQIGSRVPSISCPGMHLINRHLQ
jgi:hypothetical protein